MGLQSKAVSRASKTQHIIIFLHFQCRSHSIQMSVSIQSLKKQRRLFALGQTIISVYKNGTFQWEKGRARVNFSNILMNSVIQEPFLAHSFLVHILFGTFWYNCTIIIQPKLYNDNFSTNVGATEWHLLRTKPGGCVASPILPETACIYNIYTVFKCLVKSQMSINNSMVRARYVFRL